MVNNRLHISWSIGHITYIEDCLWETSYVQSRELCSIGAQSCLSAEVTEASCQELPVRTCQEMIVGMLTKLWADWVFTTCVPAHLYTTWSSLPTMPSRRPGEAPTYVSAKIAYLRGQKSQYSSVFIAYLRQLLKIFAIFLSTYSIFEAQIWTKKFKEPWWSKMVNCNHDEYLTAAEVPGQKCKHGWCWHSSQWSSISGRNTKIRNIKFNYNDCIAFL